MALFRGIGARKEPSPGRGTAAIEVRKDLAGLFATNAANTMAVRTGLLPVPGTTVFVAGTSGWQYLVGPFHAVASLSTGDGVQLFGNDGQVNVGTTGVGSTVPVAPGSGLSRIDIIWVRHPSAGENSDTSSQPVFGVTSGTPASTPVAPTIPAGALELARNTMTGGASTTSTASSGNAIVQTFQFAAMRGTPIHVRNQAELDAIASIASTASPVRAYRMDTGIDLVNYGAGWKVSANPGAWSAYTPAWTGATNPSVGNGSIKGRWQQIGQTVNFGVELIIGTSGASGGSGAWEITLPVPAVASGMRLAVNGQLRNGGTRRLVSGSIFSSGAAIADMVDSAGANLIAGYTLVAGAVLTFTGTYEAA